MTQTPQERSLRLACERANFLYSDYKDGYLNLVLARSIKAHALTIEKHEPAPVDPDLIEAREIIANDSYDAHWATLIRYGECDSSAEVKRSLLAIKRGRELEASK